MKSLIVYNGCGIKRDNTEIYPRYIQRLIDQSYTDDVKLVVSFCKPRSRTIPYLKSLFPDLDYIQIDDKNKKAKLIRVPKFSEVPYPSIMEPNLVIEYYSR